LEKREKGIVASLHKIKRQLASPVGRCLVVFGKVIIMLETPRVIIQILKSLGEDLY
jgi:hypothetical protein